MCRTQCVLALLALCVGLAHSWDIALSNGELLEFYTNETKTDTVRFNSQNLTALAYDDVHNMMLYVDKQSNNDTICGYDISSMQYKYLTGGNGRNIHGLAFDPVTELLFFTDTNERSISWITLKPGSKNNVSGNVFIKMDDGIPTDIAVDSCRGFIYWINTNVTTPTIERARFNGSEKEIVINLSSLSINTTYKLEPHSLAIDQQTQKIYWLEPHAISLYHLNSADLNGKNKKLVRRYSYNTVVYSNLPNRLTVSKKSLYSVGWGSNLFVWDITKATLGLKNIERKSYQVGSEITDGGVIAYYTISEQIQESQACKALTSLVRNNSVTDNPFKTATEYDGPFCVHGLKTIGQSLCKCSPGYIGERCDVSVCENYCLQGSCSSNDEGLPSCRCNAGYYGERCEVNSCHGYCLNNGDCSLDEEDEPVCQCVGNHEGSRCEVVKNDTITSSMAEGNLTLTDILLKYRKPVSKISVIVEYN